MKKWFDFLIICFALYPLGLVLGCIFSLLKIFSRIEIRNQQHFPCRQKNMIIIANHPSFLEPVLLPLLFFREYLRNPFNLPWSTPDKGLMKLILFWLWPRAIPINRDKSGVIDRIKSFRKMIEILKEGGRIVLFPEGGRTHKQRNWLFSQKGKKIGIFSQSAAFLALKAHSIIVPIWVDGAEEVLPNNRFPIPRFWRTKVKVIIKIGQPMEFTNITAEKATEQLMKILLELADEE